jgi:hypothetical protein
LGQSLSHHRQADRQVEIEMTRNLTFDAYVQIEFASKLN